MRVSEISDMSGAGLLRLPKLTYSPELLALYGLEDARSLSPATFGTGADRRHVTAQAADATGLAAGTPVIAGYFDVVAAPWVREPSGLARRRLSLEAGRSIRSSQIAPVIDERVFMVSAFAPGRFVNMENSAPRRPPISSGMSVTFVERGAHHDDPSNFVNDAVGRTKPSADDPLFHPFLYGGRMGAHQRGGFYGLAGWHDEGPSAAGAF